MYEVWAPDAGRVAVRVAGTDHPMDPDPRRPGWWRCATAPYRDGTRYAFVLDGGEPLPDPRSRRQPDGPEGASAVVDHDRFAWSTPWHGRPLPGAVLYELHVGTFTEEGTFDAAAARLDHLVALGVTHVALMPVCPFPGRHGWGYEGVCLWAVHEPYGGPDGLKRLVDAAHAHGLGVVLDVVHNHLGPSGNHLPRFGPYFTDTHHTPWGAAVNLDAPGSDEVRDFLIGSALAWLRDYRLDGLRLDAVHALVDTRAEHFLAELSAAVDRLAAATGRPLFLIAESDLNDPRTTAPRQAGGLGLHAQWSDDFHHAVHAAVTGESQGYYADFARAPMAALAKTLTRVWLHDGTYSSFRGRRHGRPVPSDVPAHRFLGYAQTHDQIGNRALGDRLTVRQLTVAAALVLTAPFTPMLFMGEEWGAATPWQFFTDHTDPELAAAVRDGRRREFAGHGWSAEEIPDPQDPATRLRSCLDWSQPHREPHAGLLRWYRELIALRATEPELTDPDLTAVEAVHDEEARWILLRRGSLRTAVNLSDSPRTLPVTGHHVLVASAKLPPGTDRLVLPPWSAAVVREP
ncbi:MULTISPECIES: malto-oligosyltrehalose trehalohydrolase [Streptomycetaceae]|uniref:Malto-oligosyltrehalose trehalohydrolase n=1 Tax=Streptantibioticus cattleyicolor (strain ATCC 35852 / DSM 46488 / JCM 4925 / NBRC 14057 / NRRL 8057) TaxID=1003195 RepID=F8JWS2_STREN|nr:malto-oligosyltrehalose trehalohydrolase [Streptantibioticus cattleyicolor]AEW97074.1 alpha amylase [Streptantibioticus cattleyicolor NRRL 8057 = DSM 46488]MYS61536.1 malto-oligosyltrehalose trehalohydrolase [Streptomyces sp. SID5468]CCB77398.1 Malto-oligosyltrehalose trehalohydrolase [Streptantibioticus cattleyicolor NRRL 8057 = DSM 46488]